MRSIRLIVDGPLEMLIDWISLGSLTISVLLSLCSVASLRIHRVSEVYTPFFSCYMRVAKMRRIWIRAWYSSDRPIGHLLWRTRVLRVRVLRVIALRVRSLRVRALSANILKELTSANDSFHVSLYLNFQMRFFWSVLSFSCELETLYEFDSFCFPFLEDGVESCFCVRIITLVIVFKLVMCIVWDGIWIGRLPAGGFGAKAYHRHLYFRLLDACVWVC